MDELPNNKTEIESIIIRECKLKGHSQKTIDNYPHHIKRFTFSRKSPRDFLLALIEKGDSLHGARKNIKEEIILHFKLL